MACTDRGYRSLDRRRLPRRPSRRKAADRHPCTRAFSRNPDFRRLMFLAKPHSQNLESFSDRFIQGCGHFYCSYASNALVLDLYSPSAAPANHSNSTACAMGTVTGACIRDQLPHERVVLSETRRRRERHWESRAAHGAAPPARHPEITSLPTPSARRST